MRHKRHVKYFGRDYNARKALIRGLVDSLVKYERIKTTVEKAKELRRHVERAITIGKEDSVHTKRVLLSKFPNKDTVFKLVKNVSPRFKERPGGYTRIIKIGRRPGDNAEMAFIELVDYDFNLKEPETKDKKVVKKIQRNFVKKKKRIRKIQKESRRCLRNNQ